MRYDRGYITPIHDKRRPIPYEWLDPHYTNRTFTEALGGLTIFLARDVITVEQYGTEMVEGAHYVYSDRLFQQFGFEKMKAMGAEAKEIAGNDRTALYYETILQKAFEDPSLDLQHIIAGVNVGNGYSYHAYGTVSENQR